MSNSSPQYDVAIIGGGVSGIYSGWRLITADPSQSKTLKKWAPKKKKLKVAVFEGGDRIGGRLLSARPPGFKNTVTEIGGMRYVSSQVLVRSLVENELKLPRFEQVVDCDENIAYLRRQHLRLSELKTPSDLPYDLDWAESEFVRQNTPSALIGWAAAKLLPGVNHLTGEALGEYLRNAIVDGTPLYEHGFWNLLARTMTPEAYSIARTLVGYDCLGSNANAVDLLAEYFDFTPGVKYYLFNQGYDAVPWTLEKKFKAAGGEVIPNSWLSGFDQITLDDNTTGVILHFSDGRPSVTARSVILAMPRRSLELLKPEGPVLDPARAPHVQTLINSVEPIPLYKLFVAYAYPWWTSVGVSQGRSLTDIPIRQCFYWPVEPDGSAPSPTGNALIMAYNDLLNVDFWAGLAGAPARHHPSLPHRLKAAATPAALFARQPMPNAAAPTDDFSKLLRKNWDDHPAPKLMVEEMHRQLVQMHNVQYAPEPLEAAFMDWSADPYGGGVHFWNRGYKSWEVLEDITQPVADFPCYICGEAYSTNQTWVEGALQTAEIVLQKRLGLPAPTWITPNPPPHKTKQKK
ncbi:FAD-dependent oxidoreductase [Granulicella sp. L60]|uniref:flavin monoamine oxidase family protein n=1 Tax=Granulicella sp. L60 TaxID=1641866 RepID=UPI00131CB7D0|nr:FAD-dependent oxidoreductase [Granulicella sp. L60]